MQMQVLSHYKHGVVWLCRDHFEEYDDRYTVGGPYMTAEEVEGVFGAKEEDICWVTPVLDEHIKDHNCWFEGGLHTKALT
jgi:hypothetical protein